MGKAVESLEVDMLVKTAVKLMSLKGAVYGGQRNRVGKVET